MHPHPRGPFGQSIPWEPGRDASLWHPRVPSELTWATGSGKNLWWMERGRVAKGLCPGVNRSHRKESVEKRGREREANISRIMWKTNKALHRTCTTHEGTGPPLEKGLEARAGK